jgi:hypothetical protein
MRALRACLAAFVGAAFLCAAPAFANDASVLQAKMRAALRSAKSFVATAAIKPGVAAPLGGTIVYTVVAPNRYRQEVHSLPGADDTIIIGDQVYGNKGDGKGWDVQTWSDRLVSGFEGDLLDITVVSIGPDTTVDGKKAGTFTMRDPHGERDSDTLACTYDKAAFTPLVCTAAYETVTFSRFNDPTVTIPTPQNAKPAGR